MHLRLALRGGGLLHVPAGRGLDLGGVAGQGQVELGSGAGDPGGGSRDLVVRGVELLRSAKRSPGSASCCARRSRRPGCRPGPGARRRRLGELFTARAGQQQVELGVGLSGLMAGLLDAGDGLLAVTAELDGRGAGTLEQLPAAGAEDGLFALSVGERVLRAPVGGVGWLTAAAASRRSMSRAPWSRSRMADSASLTAAWAWSWAATAASRAALAVAPAS